MKKVLVTGGLGYIGSHTVVELINSGYEPIIIDNLSNAHIGTLENIKKITNISPKFYEGDVANIVLLEQIKNENPEIGFIIHFAAFKAVGESVQKPLMYYKNNVNGLLSLLSAFEDKELGFVFSSSCTVYGQPDALPVTELTPTRRPESPYGNTKKMGEEILEEIAHVLPFQVISLRYFNPIGAHPSALLGELPQGIPNNLLPYITQTAKGLREKITIHGNDYNTPDGTCIRDYIHVVDLAKAHVAAIKHIENTNKPKTYDVFNIGTGRGNSVLEVLQAFETQNNLKLNYTIGPRRGGDVVEIFGNVTKAKEILGWTAEYGINEMVKTAWTWEQTL